MFYCWMQLNNVSTNTKLHSKLLCLESERTLYIKPLQELWMVLMCNIHGALLKLHSNNAAAFCKTEHSLKKWSRNVCFFNKLFVAFYLSETVSCKLCYSILHLTAKKNMICFFSPHFLSPNIFFSSLKHSKCLCLKQVIQMGV